MSDIQAFDVELKSSVCTETPDGADIFKPGDPKAQPLINTGIERNGGVANIYEKETTFTTAGANSVITTSGDLLQVDSSNNVRLNNTVIGNVGGFTVYQRGKLPILYSDAAWTATGTLIAIYLSGKTLTMDELTPSTMAILNTKSVTFAGLAVDYHFGMGIVKYCGMAFADAFEVFVNEGLGTPLLLRETGASTTAITGVTAPITSVWRFAAGKYIYGRQGEYGAWQIGDIVGATAVIPVCKWVAIEYYGSTTYSKAILTFDVFKNASNILTGYGYVGYDNAGAYTAVPAYVGINLVANTAVVVNPINAPGYSEATFTRSDTGTNIYYYVAPDQHNAAVYYDTAQCQTHTPINGYAKLLGSYNNNSIGVSPVIRACFINGLASYLSAGEPPRDVYSTLGVPLTNVGDYSPDYLHQIEYSISDAAHAYNRILYKSTYGLCFIELRNDQAKKIYKVSEDLYLINCISPVNIVDVARRSMFIGLNDYNGRILFNTAGAIVATKKIVAKISGDYVNSIDTGDKLITAVYGLTGIELPAIELPLYVIIKENYEVDVYYEDEYICSYYSLQNYLINYNKIDTLYVSDTRLPIAMGYAYSTNSAITEVSTIFTGVGVTGNTDVAYDYVGYELGNDIYGIFVLFSLCGQRYLFDGYSIYQARFNGPVFGGKDFVAPAIGMTYIASSPTAAYFLSAYDNSIYTFDGGRSLTKFARMNQSDTISEGVYNVRDNTLLLNGSASWIWIRDGIVTSNAKKATQTSISLYDTQDGIFIANNTISWQYTFLALSGSTVVPLTWQSPYFGLTANQRALFMSYVYTLYSAAKEAMTLTWTESYFDQDGEYNRTDTQEIKPVDWSSLGFYRGRIQPQGERGLAASIKLAFTKAIVINHVAIEFAPEQAAVIADTRSK